jgi:hypothetical protein
MSEEAFQFLIIYFTMFTHYLDLFFEQFYSLDIHPSSIQFLVSVAVAAVTAGSNVAGSTSWAYWIPISRVYSGSPMILARSPYSLPVLVSRAQSKVMLLTLLARSDASFLSVS